MIFQRITEAQAEFQLEGIVLGRQKESDFSYSKRSDIVSYIGDLLKKVTVIEIPGF